MPQAEPEHKAAGIIIAIGFAVLFVCIGIRVLAGAF